MSKGSQDTYTGYSLIRDGIQSLYENGVKVEDLHAEVKDAFEAHILDIVYGLTGADGKAGNLWGLDEEIEQEYIASEEVPF